MAAISPNGVLLAYPAPQGSKNESVKTFVGPSSYAVVVIAAPPTGGIKINATDMGLSDFDQVVVWGSDEGTYGARVIFPNQPRGPVLFVRIQVFTLATGAEISNTTDLSAKTFRIWAKQGS